MFLIVITVPTKVPIIIQKKIQEHSISISGKVTNILKVKNQNLYGFVITLTKKLL